MPRNIKELLLCGNCLKPLAENEDRCPDCEEETEALSHDNLTPEQMKIARKRTGNGKK